MAATTGVETATEVIKYLLAGADVVHVEPEASAQHPFRLGLAQLVGAQVQTPGLIDADQDDGVEVLGGRVDPAAEREPERNSPRSCVMSVGPVPSETSLIEKNRPCVSGPAPFFRIPR